MEIRECPHVDTVLEKLEDLAYESIGRGVPDISTVLSVLHLSIRVGMLDDLAKTCILFHNEKNLDQLEDELEAVYEPAGVQSKT